MLTSGSRSTAGPGSALSTPDEQVGPLALYKLARKELVENQGVDRNTWARGAESVSPSLQRAGRPSLRDTPTRSGLQHEQLVSVHTPTGLTPGAHMGDGAVDLSDLQNYLSWDMYGIMEVGASGLKAGIEGNGLPSWTGAR